MATRAERFRAEQERSRPKTKTRKTTAAKKRTTSLRGRAPTRGSALEATKESGNGQFDRLAGGRSTGRRNLSKGKSASFAYEDSLAPKRPSRKSTRRSKNRQKAGATLHSTQLHNISAPEERHARSRASTGAAARSARRF